MSTEMYKPEKLVTRVVNVRTYQSKDYVLVDRRTAFGNPFKIGIHGTRHEVCKKYRKYFYQKIEDDPQFEQEVLALAGCILGCWCHPEECHAHIIADYLNHEN